MKNISFLFVILVAALMMSCSRDSQNAAPVNQTSLSMVVAKAAVNNGSENQLLLKDGRTANPVSGIPGFNNMPIGSKLSLMFVEGAKHDGVVDINVTQYDTIHAVEFVPQGSTSSSDDLEGTFAGSVYKANGDSTSILRGTTSITFSHANYSCTASSCGYPQASSGTWTTANDLITFTDGATNTDNHLKGTFHYYLREDELYLWNVLSDGGYVSFSMKKNK